MDTIYLTGLSFFANHGLFEEEARLGQRFIVDLKCELDLSAASKSDKYEDTVCYGSLAKLVESVVTNNRFNLIERLAGAICEAVLDYDSRIERVSITLHKPSAPVPVATGCFKVEITQQRI
ncbi:dihydroneopterin aldolase [Polycladidibacter hongkongensis]|uniref:dihydroneopterin aldolase n=1 Tax=Polycladidibacter hongkongensis TaxID=1647556 RepID=UPI00082FF5F2|nr:dihydroneopterin aldolase [Pseudovibrio hongkongensis]